LIYINKLAYLARIFLFCNNHKLEKGMAHHILQGDDAATVGNLFKVISVLVSVMIALIVIALVIV